MSKVRAFPRLMWPDLGASGRSGLEWRDWVLFATLISLALLEWVMRPGLPVISVLAGVAVMPTVLWRRARPLLMVAIGFGVTSTVTVIRIATGSDLPGTNASAFLLLLPYALFRWGSGREVTIGTPVVLSAASFGLLSEATSVGEIMGGLGVVITSMAVGAAVRYRDHARLQTLEQAKSRERERLARDLHDTVAHHVSAIAIRAQAGLATSKARDEPAVDALRIIEAEASRTLVEMRAMVRSLRDGSLAHLAPLPGIADIERLASSSVGDPEVVVSVCGDVQGVSPTASAAVYRLAQESITNARRHARNATRVEVTVSANEEEVRLRVRDDGEPTPAGAPAQRGFGHMGMIERSEALGGSCQMGPDPEGGWTVTAVLPRDFAAR